MSTRKSERTNDEIEMQIFSIAVDQGSVVVDTESDLPRALGLSDESTTRVCNRVGSMVKRKLIIRKRRHMDSLHDDDRPITYAPNPKYAAM